MPTITLEEAQKSLPALIERLRPGEELVILRDNTPVARLVGTKQVSATRRRPGTARGQLTITADDDEHLRDFGEYMP